MRIGFVLNGAAVEVETAPDRRLLALLREDFGLAGAREGVDPGGDFAPEQPLADRMSDRR